MSLETSTINVLLGLMVAGQCWIVKEIIGINIKIARMSEHCPHCPDEKQ